MFVCGVLVGACLSIRAIGNMALQQLLVVGAGVGVFMPLQPLQRYKCCFVAAVAPIFEYITLLLSNYF